MEKWTNDISKFTFRKMMKSKKKSIMKKYSNLMILRIVTREKMTEKSKKKMHLNVSSFVWLGNNSFYGLIISLDFVYSLG